MSDPISADLKKTRLAVSVFFFISGISYASWASRIPTIQQELHLNEAMLGTVLFALPLGLIMTLPVSGYLVSKTGSRYVMLIGSVVYTLFLCLLGFVTKMWQLVTVLFFFGSSRNLLNIAANTQAVGVEGLYKKPIMSTFHGIWSVAGLAGALIGSFMLSKHVPTATHFAIIGAATMIATAIYFPTTFKHDGAIATKKPLFVKPDRGLLKLGFMAFASMACEGTMYDWCGVYFKKEVHASPSFINAGYTSYMCAMAIGRFTGDWVRARLGTKRVLELCGLLITSGLLTIVFFPYVITGIIGSLMVGLGVSCIVPLVFSVAGKSSKMATGAALASISTIGYIGFLLGPPVIGYIAQVSDLKWSFAIVSLIGLAVTYLAGRMKL